MMVLAQHIGDEPVMTKEIAEKQNLPVTYLEQLMLTLRKAGLVVATRGAKGGYVLAKSAGNISLSEIVEALEGPLNIADCEDVPSCCLVPESCALQELFSRANRALKEVFGSVTLGELAEKQNVRDQASASMYFI